MEDGLDILIANLRNLKGAAFWQQLAVITERPEFKMIENGIFCTTSTKTKEFERQLNAARKVVSYGYAVYILPNPKGVKSADFIFRRKGVYFLYELKTILGRNSLDNRLADSIHQSNRVLLNLNIRYKPRYLAFEIARFFRENKEAKEVLILYKQKKISIKSNSNAQLLWKQLLGAK